MLKVRDCEICARPFLPRSRPQVVCSHECARERKNKDRRAATRKPARPRESLPEGERRCIKCRAVKPLREFGRDRTSKLGRSYLCKPCGVAKARAYHARPEVKLRAREWRRADYARGGKTKTYSAFYNAMRPREERMWRSARERARRAGLEFTIGVADIVIPETCPLLGTSIEPAIGRRGAHANSPSLDRIDPARGYVPGNVWVISYRANAIKQDATPEELEAIAVNLRRRLTKAEGH